MVDSVNLVKFSNVVKRYGSFIALKNFSFKIRAYEILGIVGPNGSGKTTIVNLIYGFIKPSSGFISVFGREPFKSQDFIRRNVSICFENAAFHRNVIVEDYLRYICGGDEYVKFLEYFDFSEQYLSKKIKELSAGYRLNTNTCRTKLI